MVPYLIINDAERKMYPSPMSFFIFYRLLKNNIVSQLASTSFVLIVSSFNAIATLTANAITSDNSKRYTIKSTIPFYPSTSFVVTFSLD